MTQPALNLMDAPSAPAPENAQAALTPMMTQYWAVKNAHPDCLLFYRMGDFYELFFDDAVTAARVLDIALTRRGKHQGQDIPMCGVPFHSHDSYLARLIRAGYHVAICEQTETPEEAKKRSGKTLVNRDVVRIITPGTLTEDHLLDGRAAHYLACISGNNGAYGLAWLDVSTGTFMTQATTAETLAAALERVSAREVLVSERLAVQPDIASALGGLGRALTVQPASLFDPDNAIQRLNSTFGIRTLDSFGAFSRAEATAAGALLDYVVRTQKGQAPHVRPPQRVQTDLIVDMDPATRRNLELHRTQSGATAGSLLATIDRTLTGAGARLLSERLAAPSRNLETINSRLDSVTLFVEMGDLRTQVRSALRETPDLERALTRLSLGRGGPRDLAIVRDTLKAASTMQALLTCAQTPVTTATLASWLHALTPTPALTALSNRLERALADPLPVLVRDGGFIKAGYDDALDTQRTLRDDSRRIIAKLQGTYSAEVGIPTLKIGHNNVLGYFIELPAKQGEKLLVHNRAGTPTSLDSTPTQGTVFVHRQTLANVMRFTTPALTDIESQILKAADIAQSLEAQIFEALRAEVLSVADTLAGMIAALADLDVSSALADLAVVARYVRPTLDDSARFEITGGRHPVVEAAMAQNSAGPFIPNDCTLSSPERLWLLTGPNMAGKSTFLRQNALIAILAHMGSFVPAKAAHIGLVDRIFSRVGAADDLARGRSTFMVEMVETASILHQATDRSLVILDEIGRGTATFDGLSIAWACLEYLHDNTQCRGLFATHYHELTQLTTRLSQLVCYAMQVREHAGDIIFLHSIGRGHADHSYGLHVARLAGLPAPVIARAQTILHTLEAGKTAETLGGLSQTLPVFSVAAAQPETAPSPVLVQLDAIDPDTLTPRAALEALYALKALHKK